MSRTGSFCKPTLTSIITIYISVASFKMLFVYSTDDWDIHVCSRLAAETFVYFHPDSCCSEVHSLTSAPKLESETNQNNLNDHTAKSCTEHVSYWQNGDCFGQRRNCPPFIETGAAFTVFHSFIMCCKIGLKIAKAQFNNVYMNTQ